MTANEKRELTPEERAERKRRMEAKKRRQQELKRKKQKRILVIAGVILAVVVVLGIIGFFAYKMANGSPKEIAAKGETFVIAIDPGHGGEDTGMVNGSVSEKQVTLDICEKLKIMLESQGYNVIMTRESDTRLGKEARVSAVNASSADLLVSVHCCYSEDSTISGAISHYKADSKESVLLAENIQAQLLDETGAEDGGVKEGSYTILSNTEIPSVLVEVGYLSNTQETDALGDDSYQNDAAKGIAKGIILSLDRD